MKLIYQKISSWEIEFITKDLFIDFEVIFTSCEDLMNVNTYTDDMINNCIFVFTSNKNSYKDIEKIVIYLKPIIIVHLSDEFGSRPEYQHLSTYTKLLLRQYNITKYPTYRNIEYLPLGYNTGFKNNSYITPASERRYLFSFVGDIKNKDGDKMINKMSMLKPHFIHLSNPDSNKLKPCEIKDIYVESIFVPSRRGFKRLDCFRIYEALECGSIPIIVGDDEEIKNTFKYKQYPPWIFCDSWKNARKKCEKLIESKSINTLQKENYEWWLDTKEYYKKMINKTINEYKYHIR